jgi:hypothetical protein
MMVFSVLEMELVLMELVSVLVTVKLTSLVMLVMLLFFHHHLLVQPLLLKIVLNVWPKLVLLDLDALGAQIVLILLLL